MLSGSSSSSLSALPPILSGVRLLVTADSFVETRFFVAVAKILLAGARGFLAEICFLLGLARHSEAKSLPLFVEVSLGRIEARIALALG